MPEKKFDFYVLVNWKNGNVKALKRKPNIDKLSPFLIPIRVKLTVKVPERKEIVAEGEITLSEQQVEKMIIEEI